MLTQLLLKYKCSYLRSIRRFTIPCSSISKYLLFSDVVKSLMCFKCQNVCNNAFKTISSDKLYTNKLHSKNDVGR